MKNILVNASIVGAIPPELMNYQFMLGPGETVDIEVWDVDSQSYALLERRTNPNTTAISENFSGGPGTTPIIRATVYAAGEGVPDRPVSIPEGIAVLNTGLAVVAPHGKKH